MRSGEPVTPWSPEARPDEVVASSPADARGGAQRLRRPSLPVTERENRAQGHVAQSVPPR